MHKLNITKAVCSISGVEFIKMETGIPHPFLIHPDINIPLSQAVSTLHTLINRRADVLTKEALYTRLVIYRLCSVRVAMENDLVTDTFTATTLRIPQEIGSAGFKAQLIEDPRVPFQIADDAQALLDIIKLRHTLNSHLLTADLDLPTQASIDLGCWERLFLACLEEFHAYMENAKATKYLTELGETIDILQNQGVMSYAEFKAYMSHTPAYTDLSNPEHTIFQLFNAYLAVFRRKHMKKTAVALQRCDAESPAFDHTSIEALQRCLTYHIGTPVTKLAAALEICTKIVEERRHNLKLTRAVLKADRREEASKKLFNIFD